MAVKLVEIMSCDRCLDEIPRGAEFSVNREAPDLVIRSGGPAWFPTIEFGDLCDDCRAVVAERLSQIARGSGWTVATGIARTGKPLVAKRRSRSDADAGQEPAPAPPTGELVLPLSSTPNDEDPVVAGDDAGQEPPGTAPSADSGGQTASAEPSPEYTVTFPGGSGGLLVDEVVATFVDNGEGEDWRTGCRELARAMPLPEGVSGLVYIDSMGRWFSWTLDGGEIEHESRERAERAVQVWRTLQDDDGQDS